MEHRVFRFVLDEDEKKNGKAVYNLILNLKAKQIKKLDIEPLEEPRYSGKIRGIVLAGEAEEVSFAAAKVIKFLKEKKIQFTENTAAAQDAPICAAEGAQIKDPSLEKELKSGIAFYHLGLYEDSFEQLLKVINKEPNNFLALQHIGLVYEQKEDYDKAIASYQRSLDAREDLSSTRFFLGNVYQKLGKYEEAIEEYKKAIKLDPEIPILYNNLAWSFYQVGDYDKAIRSFEEAVSLDPDLPFPYNGLGCIYQEMGYLEDAVEEFLQATELFPEYSAAHLKLGWVYYQMGDYDKAAVEFNLIIDQTEDENYLLSAHYSLANTFLAQNLLEESYEEFLQVVKIDESFADAYFHLGVICSKLELHEEAVSYLHKSIEKSSRLKDEAHLYLAFSYTRLKKFDEALSECKIALKFEPNDPEIYSIMGSVYSSRQDWPSSIDAFSKALELNPNSARTSFNLALSYENKEDYENAVKYYKNTISTDRNFLEAYTNLGWLYLDLDKNEEALVLFERAAELKKDDPELLNNLGWAYSKSKKYKDALECYKKALKFSPHSPVILNNMGIVANELSYLPEALHYFQEALKFDADKDKSIAGYAHFYIGLIYQKQEKYKEAIDEFNIAKKLDEVNKEVYYYIGQCYEKLSQTHKAYKYQEKYLEIDPEGKFAEEVKEKLKGGR